MRIRLYQNGAAWYVRIEGELVGGFHKKEYAEIFINALRGNK